MMKLRHSIILSGLGVICGTTILLTGCQQLSEKVEDPAAGLNGGFEIDQRGLPVNWIMYTPKTVKAADFDIIIDRETFKEGQQSLKFEVRRATGQIGWHAPGFTNEFFDVGRFYGPAQYRLSFWIRNSGAEFIVAGGPVSLKGGDMRTLVRDNSSTDGWKQYEYTIEVPEEQWLRMQLNIISPGSFWIDGIKIEKIN